MKAPEGTGTTLARRDFLRAVLGASATTAVGVGGANATQDSGTVEWRFDTGGGVFSSPTVVGGTVYVGARGNTLYAVDAESGEQSWAFTGPIDAIHSSPTVVDGTVYAGALDNTLYAVDAESGEEAWRFANASGTLFSSPTVVDRTVYVGSHDSNLYAVDADSGDQKWSFTEPSAEIYSSPAVVDGTVYVGSHDSNLYAVDADSGDQKWSFTEPSAEIYSSPAVVDGTVYVGSHDGNLYAVDAGSGDEEWTFTEPSAEVYSSPTVVGGAVYVGSWDGTLYAVDVDSGDREWAFSSPSGEVWSTPTVAGGTVYIGATDATLYAVDAATGEQEWAFSELAELTVSSPTVAGDIVYIGTGRRDVDDDGTVTSADGAVYAVDTASGDLQWIFDDPSNIVSAAPTVVDGTLFVRDDDGLLYAVETGTDASSQGSRVLLGTLGHTGDARPGEPIEAAPGDDTETTQETGADSEDTETPDSAAGSTETDDEGLVTPAGLAAVGGGGIVSLLGGYALLRRSRSSSEESTDDDPGRISRSTTATASGQRGGSGADITGSGNGTASNPIKNRAADNGQVDNTATRVGDRTRTGNSDETPETPIQADDSGGVTGTSQKATTATDDTEETTVEDNEDRPEEDTTVSAEQATGGEVVTNDRTAASTETASTTGDDTASESETGSDTEDGTETEDKRQKADVAPSLPDDRKEVPELESAVTVLESLVEQFRLNGLITYRGWHAEERAVVSVYTLATEVSDEATRTAFERAAEDWYDVTTHENVVTIHDGGTDPRPWLAVEHVDDAETLTEFADSSNEKIGAVVRDVAAALDSVETAGSQHGNLTPEHISIVETDTDGVQARVGGWGILPAIRDAQGRDHITRYMAPEQLPGSDPTPSAATDVYSLGAVAYYGLTGEPPVPADSDAIRGGNITPPSEVAELPEALDAPVMRALAPDPDARFGSATAFAAALDDALSQSES
jgi:outer membrane protein assembly factor BamB